MRLWSKEKICDAEVIKIIQEHGFPKKVFGELTLKGGLNNMQQTLKTKYLLPTKDYPTGKAVIEIIVPEHINKFSIDKNEIQILPDLNENLLIIQDKIEEPELKHALAQQLKFNNMLFEIASAEKNKPFAVKSFRFTEKDYMATQDLMSHLGKLFGYLFYKYKAEVEKEGSDEHLARARDVVAVGISQKVHKNFIEGFMEGVNEKINQNIVSRKNGATNKT